MPVIIHFVPDITIFEIRIFFCESELVFKMLNIKVYFCYFLLNR